MNKQGGASVRIALSGPLPCGSGGGLGRGQRLGVRALPGRAVMSERVLEPNCSFRVRSLIHVLQSTLGQPLAHLVQIQPELAGLEALAVR